MKKVVIEYPKLTRQHDHTRYMISSVILIHFFFFGSIPNIYTGLRKRIMWCYLSNLESKPWICNFNYYYCFFSIKRIHLHCVFHSIYQFSSCCKLPNINRYYNIIFTLYSKMFYGWIFYTISRNCGVMYLLNRKL